jgi:hypothetical protein
MSNLGHKLARSTIADSASARNRASAGANRRGLDGERAEALLVLFFIDLSTRKVEIAGMPAARMGCG